MLKYRLFWELLSPLDSPDGPIFACKSQTAFTAAEDYTIILNDWPYGISPEITHLIAWSKVRLSEQKPEGHLTPESAALAQSLVQREIVDKLTAVGVQDAEKSVLWFRNWTGLQSVRGLEHVHILVRNSPRSLMAEWIANAIPKHPISHR